jgi:hypothetical protein
VEPDDLRQRVPLWRANDELQVRVSERQQLRDILLRSSGRLKEGLVDKLIEADTVHWGKDTKDKGFTTNFKAKQRMTLMPELKEWIQKLWSASPKDIPELLEEFWNDGITGGGASLPTMIVHLRYPEQFAPWYFAAHEGVGRRQSDWFAFPRHKQTWSLYSLYNDAVQRERNSIALRALEGDLFFAWLAPAK